VAPFKSGRALTCTVRAARSTWGRGAEDGEMEERTAVSAQERLRVAIVGCGGVARTQHAPAYERLAQRGLVEVVATCDVDASRAQALAERFGARAYPELSALLERERPDVVDVCTPEDRHTEPVLAALQAGAHVLCEKIMSESLASGRRMVEVARRCGRWLGVDYNYRFMPALATAHDLIAAGALGELAVIGISAHAFCFHHALDLVRFLGSAAGEVVAVGAQYSATADPAYHFRVQLQEFVYVPSRCEVATFRFASGALAVIYGTRFMDLRQQMLRVEVAGSAGRLVASGLTIQNVVGELRRYRFSGDPSGPARRPEGEPVPLAVPSGASPDFQLAFDWSITAFIEAVAAGRRPPVTGEDGLRVLELEHAIVRSAREGRFVEV